MAGTLHAMCDVSPFIVYGTRSDGALMDNRHWFPFEIVNAQYYNPVCALNQNDDLQVCLITEENGIRTLKHAVRRAASNLWTVFGDVQDQTALVNGQRVDNIYFLGCASAGNDLHVCVIQSGWDFDDLWHTIRKADGTWPHAFGNVQDQTALVSGWRLDRISNVACAADPNGNLHVCVFGSRKDLGMSLWHTVRKADGTWPYAFGNVIFAATGKTILGDGTGLRYLSCAANQNGDLHICVTDDEGDLWHVLRLEDGTWPGGFESISTDQIKGEESQTWIKDISCSVDKSNGNLHVCILTETPPGARPNEFWHTIRQPDGTWTAFENVLKELNMVNAYFTAVSICHD